MNFSFLFFSVEDFNPRPVDLSTMTLEKDMMNTAERMAEHSHNIWAKKVYLHFF